IYVLVVTETIVLLVTKNSALLFTDYNWIASGDPYSCKGLTQGLPSRWRWIGLFRCSAFTIKLAPLHNKKAPHFVRGFVTRIVARFIFQLSSNQSVNYCRHRSTSKKPPSLLSASNLMTLMPDGFKSMI
ncbi:hypothetical protein ACX0G9_18955, partial [Flavitalea flava]